MRITKLNVNDSLLQGGLKPIVMRRLGKVVLIAGKNGSGKTRLLANVRQLVSRLSNEPVSVRMDYENAKSKLARIYDEASKLPEGAMSLQISQYQDRVNALKTQLDVIESVHLDTPIQHRNIVNFVPKELKLSDPSDTPPSGLRIQAENLDSYLGVEVASQSSLFKIQWMQNRYYNATHPDTSCDSEEKELAIKSYEALKKTVNDFLGTEIGRDLDGNFTLFGKSYREANLSDGQRVLLQLCLALYSQSTQLSNSLIFLDEPENHLHPEALIYVVQNIERVLTHGQLWIATHSIHLLGHFESNSIWYMEDGGISHAGKAPERVLKGLVGGEDEIAKLANFLTLPAQMASVQFAFECLLPPLAIQTGSEDPQTNQIIEAIRKKIDGNEKIKVLDFGSGQGRLLASIKDIDNEIETARWLDYLAYDPHRQSECESVIESVYGASSQRYFNTPNELLSAIEFHTFDMIVMCNVFHEMDPMNWLDDFSEHSIIRSCLKPDGILLIVEDQLIPIGEKAYANGFLVFDTVQFKKLFSIKTYEVIERKDGRLKAHFIPSSSLGNLTSETRKLAIGSLQFEAKNQITALRSKDGNTSNGRLHAFWCQQMVNSSLVMSQLDGNRQQ